ncbi:hypothetical protein SAMN05444581_11141 [Methylocapsa palsarum]|uniref:Uncharacterized protein n=1 Tax=Methylocapsa palsarum TaxID=1612308 RepID=A0A1I4APS8_9HYPH|nr:hypothetical protein SAMN05444581_11141 [Methylocapsa palsarum]
MTIPLPQQVTAIHAVPARLLNCGFRLLILRELRIGNDPSNFAWIEQNLFRKPQRLNRHGLSFATAFLPEIVSWLSETSGRPTLHSSTGAPCRNARWPVLAWRGEDRVWTRDVKTIEWFVDAVFYDDASWSAFRQRWRDRLCLEKAQA